METLPIIFRKKRGKQYAGEITAVFPTLPADTNGHELTVYAHIGQHGGASFGWYNETIAATPDDYAPLLAELRSIYETGEDAVSLKVYKRMTPQHRAAFNAEARRYRAMAS